MWIFYHIKAANSHGDSNHIKRADAGYERVCENFGIQLVPAWEGLGHAWVVLLEGLPRLGADKRVGVAEEPVAEHAVVVVDAVELARFKLLEMGNRLLRDVELGLAVLALVQPLVLADVENVILL